MRKKDVGMSDRAKITHLIPAPPGLSKYYYLEGGAALVLHVAALALAEELHDNPLDRGRPVLWQKFYAVSVEDLAGRGNGFYSSTAEDEDNYVGVWHTSEHHLGVEACKQAWLEDKAAKDKAAKDKAAKDDKGETK